MEEYGEDIHTPYLNNSHIVYRMNGAHPLCIACHSYNFFVDDAPQVLTWQITPPREPQAIEALATSCRESGYDLHATLELAQSAG